MTYPARAIRFGLATLFVALLAFCAAPARALQPDELLLIVNKNIPAGLKGAEFYARARNVPDGRILELDLPGSEEIPFDRYEREVVPAIRSFLRRNDLADKVQCLVTFYGVPIRIGPKRTTPEEQQEIAEVRQLIDETWRKIDPRVSELEALARQLNPDFQPAAGAGIDSYVERTNHAVGAVVDALPLPDDPRYPQLAARLLSFLAMFTGDAEVLRKFTDEQLQQLVAAQDRDRWANRRQELVGAHGEIATLQERRSDPQARRRLRSIVADDFGLFGLINLLHSQLEYLQNDGSVAALDNELSLLWWDYYSRSRYLPNPRHYRFHGQPVLPTLMVMRLDGPQEGTIGNIILGSLRAEKDGLLGRFAIDSTGGTAPGGGVDREGGYRAFDQRLLRLSTIVRAHTDIPITLDRTPQVFAPGTVNDVALYCGWYSVRNYVPAFTFKPGAVAYHVASFEMISLRSPEERGWVAGLLNDGVAVTIGSVAEPYLHAFPPPDEFFPLLLTGKMTLAEVYWTTTPMVSWMMSCIGDPLYNPYKNNPALTVDQLPDDLKVLFRQPAPPPLAETYMGPSRTKNVGKAQLGP